MIFYTLKSSSVTFQHGRKVNLKSVHTPTKRPELYDVNGEIMM